VNERGRHDGTECERPPETGRARRSRRPRDSRATVADVDGLRELYEGLDDDDRYTRFFSLYRPDRAFYERMASAGERGGCELVAVVASADEHEGRIIGEAGYTLLPNGDGELAITIGKAWRGWLGPYLLDALVAEAARRNVTNLEAEILLANRPMLALARSRGYVTKEHTDWSMVHVVIGTAERSPRWPTSDDRPRVLVETPGGRWHAAADARAANLEVLVCPGPDENRRCPVLAGRACPLARDADVIVVAPPAENERWDTVLDAHARLHAGVPICVELPSGVDAPLPESAVRAPRGGTHAVVALVQRLAGQAEAARSET
jgi:hypothetical protein